MQPKITVYDKYNYDYSSYWEKRQYEHLSETYALKKALKSVSGNWFIDIGGSYGRHSALYTQKFHNCILFDYSMNALRQAQDKLHNQGIRNVILVAGNVYNLPFKNNTFDGAMMIRVLHHLEKPEEGLKECSRIMKPNSPFILEFANKFHLKSIIKSLFKFDFKFIFSREPYLIPSRGSCEGSRRGEQGIIYNFAPSYLRRIFRNSNFNVKKIYALSFFRIALIKKLVPTKILLFFEKISQLLFSWILITPSIIYKAVKDKSDTPVETYDNIYDIICCPKCGKEFNTAHGRIQCGNCGERFSMEGKIFDLRFPKSA